MSFHRFLGRLVLAISALFLALPSAALTLGVALARERILSPFLADGRLVRLDLPGMPARWGYHVVYPAHRRPSPAAQGFIDWLVADVARFGP